MFSPCGKLVVNTTLKCRRKILYNPNRFQNNTGTSKEENTTSAEPGIDSSPYKEITKQETKEDKESLIHPLEFRDVSQVEGLHGKHPKNRPKFLTKFQYGGSYNQASALVGLKYTLAKFHNKQMLKDQSYKPERVSILGPDLSAAHFFMYRGAAIKFVGQDNFMRCVNKSSQVLPNYRDDSYKVEAVDASNMDLIYESIQNLSDLKYLKWLSFKNVEKFDNWYLDYLSSLALQIEYLDLSFCKKLDYNALSCLYRFTNLRCLNVEGLDDNSLFKLACLTLEAENPNLIIIGLVLKKKPKSAFN